MRLAWLYLRSRLAGPTLAGIALTAMLAIACERWAGDHLDVMTAALIFVPLPIACLVGASSHSPFGETERTGSLSLPRIRCVHLAGLAIIGLLALLLAATQWSLPDDGLTLARNLAGLTGLALLAAPIVGARLSWIAPVTLALLGQLLESAETMRSLVLTWPQAAFENERALLVALALLGGGLLAIYVVGPKTAQDEVTA